MSTIQELRQQAKDRGLNTHGMKKEEIEMALNDEGARDVQQEPQVTDRGERPEGREEAAPRRVRKPMGTMEQKLAYPARPGYHRRWFNDVRNRIARAQEAGYEFVLENRDGREEKVSALVGTNEDGSPMTAYLMEIRQEFYNEDQAAKQAAVDEIDAAIMRGVRGQDAEQGRYYTPSEGTSMRAEN